MSSFAVVSDAEAAYAFCKGYFGLSRTEYQKGLILLKGPEIIAAVVYENYNKANIFMHVAAKPGRKWLNRHFLHEGFKFPFVTLGCARITGWVEASNVDAQRFNEHLGFVKEAVLERAAPDKGDVIIYRMFREDCRYA